MNILMVTPHLPPHQAANALLPHLLGHGAADPVELAFEIEPLQRR